MKPYFEFRNLSPLHQLDVLAKYSTAPRPVTDYLYELDESGSLCSWRFFKMSAACERMISKILEAGK